MRQFTTRSIVVFALLLAGMGTASAQTQAPDAATAVPLGARPTVVTKFCVERARRGKFTVLCPNRYPRTARSRVNGSGRSVLGPSFYWASFNDAAGFNNNGDNGHLIFGGQRQPLSLAGSPGQTWPRPGRARPVKQLGLPRLITTQMGGGGQFIAQRPPRIMRRTMVGARQGLVLVAPPYPFGGFMGGHLIVLWNQQQHGYVLSFHLEAAPDGHAY